MGERALTANVKAEIIKGHVRIAVFVEGLFDGGAVRFWSGVGPKTLGGNVFTGTGILGGVTQIEENADDIKAAGLAYTLSGIPTDEISRALNEQYQGRLCTLWIAFFDLNWQLIADEIKMFSGRMDYPVIDEGGDTASITVHAESLLIDLERPRVRRYTHEDQINLSPGDKFLEFVAGIQNTEIVWKSPGAP